MANLIEALDKISEVYFGGVEENDNKYPFLPEAYKTLTEKFLAKVEKDLNVHIIDLEYLDGYYIFGYGTNSVIHFRIKECKGWKFGIWWNYDEEEYFKYNGELFAQYERAIDKFKPEDSELVENIKISDVENFEKDGAWTTMPIKMIKYIKEYPAFAFCRHWEGFNGKYDYMPYHKAKRELRLYNLSEDLGEFINNAITKMVIRYMKRNYLRYLPKGYELIDRGDCWSPRYEFAIPISAFKGELKEVGMYTFEEFDCIPNIEKKKEKEKKFYKLESKLNKLKILRSVYIHGVYNIRRGSINVYDDSKKGGK